MSNQPFLPYGRQWVDEADIAAVVEVLRGDFLTTGPAVGQFEQRLAAATGASHAVACNSGTSALHMMYAAMGVGQGDEIITSPLTFAATANAAHYLGASVKFVDVTPDTGNLDPALVAAAVTPRTKLIVPVDFGGHPADYDAIHAVAAAQAAPHSSARPIRNCASRRHWPDADVGFGSQGAMPVDVRGQPQKNRT